MEITGNRWKKTWMSQCLGNRRAAYVPSKADDHGWGERVYRVKDFGDLPEKILMDVAASLDSTLAPARVCWLPFQI